jgi:hypothetical protein
MPQENIQEKLDALQTSVTDLTQAQETARDFIGVKLAVISGRMIVLEAKLDQIIELGKTILGELEEPPVAVSGKVILGTPEPR